MLSAMPLLEYGIRYAEKFRCFEILQQPYPCNRITNFEYAYCDFIEQNLIVMHYQTLYNHDNVTIHNTIILYGMYIHNNIHRVK